MTYPAKDSHSKIVPYVIRDHAWNYDEEDKTGDKEYDQETNKTVQAGEAYRKPVREEEAEVAAKEAAANEAAPEAPAAPAAPAEGAEGAAAPAAPAEGAAAPTAQA